MSVGCLTLLLEVAVVLIRWQSIAGAKPLSPYADHQETNCNPCPLDNRRSYRVRRGRKTDGSAAAVPGVEVLTGQW